MVALPVKLHTASIDPPEPAFAKRDRAPAFPFIVLAGALNDASNQCLIEWLDGRLSGEGIHAWLIRLGSQAMKSRSDMDAHQFEHAGIRWTFGMIGDRAALVKVENLKGFTPTFSQGFRDAIARARPYGRQ